MAGNRLTTTIINAAKKPGKLYDEGRLGLYLNVAPGGSKSWLQRITIDGKRREIGLGGYPVVTLLMARKRALDNKRAVADGRDPLAEKRRARVPTFAEAAQATFDSLKAGWRGARAKDWKRPLENHAYPVLGSLRVDAIGREHALRVLSPIWSEKPAAARKLRQRIKAVLRWAQAHGFVTENIAGEAIDGALSKRPAKAGHFRAMPYRDVPDALLAIETANASMAAKLCLRFVITTAVRGVEARGATWDEIDIAKREWRIPGSRTKTGAEHRVPLTAPALEVLMQARILNESSRFVFPSPVKRLRPLNDTALLSLLAQAGLKDRTTVHGFRSSFRDWAAECTDSPHAVMELALAHRVGSAVEQAYARSDLLAKRRELMERWAQHLQGA